MGMLSEDRAGEGLALGLSVADNLTCSRLDDLGPGFLVLPSRQAATATRWIDRLAIRCADSRQAVGQLSGGNQQKVAVGRLLHHDVDVLISTSRRAVLTWRAGADLRVDRFPGGVGKAEAVLRSAATFRNSSASATIAVMSRGRLGPRARYPNGTSTRC
jgi:ABC-type uncharacterized transport system ATPase subunit